MSYIPEKYWNKRLLHNFNLSAVGHIGFNEYYNRWLYKAKIKTLKEVMKSLGLVIYGKTICDIGCGTGFFVDFYHSQRVEEIIGIDITNISIDNLKKKYPQYKFIKGDISSPQLVSTINLSFDILNVFDVLYHIVDDETFIRAITNIVSLTKKNGIIFLSDLAGQNNISVAPHVRFRSKGFYEKILDENNTKIIGIYPLYYFMNQQILGKFKVRFFKKIGVKLDNLCVPVYYYLDRLFLSIEKSNLNLIVARKIKL